MKYSASAVPGWLLFMGMTAVALTAVGGVVALLVMGRTVPGELWGFIGAIGVAYFGAGPFTQVLNRAAVHESHLLDTTNHSIESQRMVALAYAPTMTTNPIPTTEETT